MTRLCFTLVAMLGLFIPAVGCGGGNVAVEDTRSPAEIEQQMKEYEKQMESSSKSATNK